MKLALAKQRFQAGFTLMELMVVLAIMGIMTAVIVPEMRGSYEDALLHSSSRELMSAFSLAYSRAVSLNQTHRVHLDRSNGKYQIEKSGQGSEFVAVQDISGAKGTIDRKISIQIETGGQETEPAPTAGAASPPPVPFALPTDSVAFYPDGTADSVQVILQDREGFRQALRVNPVTARVKIVELERR